MGPESITFKRRGLSSCPSYTHQPIGRFSRGAGHRGARQAHQPLRMHQMSNLGLFSGLLMYAEVGDAVAESLVLCRVTCNGSR